MNQHRRIGLTDAASFLLAIYYLWYQLPFMRATFQAERYKYLFFACFAAGILLLCAARLENCRMRVRLTLRVSVLTPVLLYMAVMAVCYLLHAGDAARHIRVSFSFWGTLLVYRLFSFDRRAQVRFGRYLLFLFLLTALTSAAAVLTDSSAARAISNASQRPEAVARDYVLMRRNVSGIYLFQDLVIFAPISVLMLLQRRKPLMNGLILCNRILGFVNAPAVAQQILMECADAQVDLNIYRARRAAMAEVLTDAGIKFTMPKGAFYFFPKSPVADDKVFIEALVKECVLAVPGSAFGGPGYFRMAFCVDEKVIRAAAPGMKRAVEAVLK